MYQIIKISYCKKYKIIRLQVKFSYIKEKIIGYSIIKIHINGINILKTVFTKVFENILKLRNN